MIDLGVSRHVRVVTMAEFLAACADVRLDDGVWAGLETLVTCLMGLCLARAGGRDEGSTPGWKWFALRGNGWSGSFITYAR